MYVKSENGFWVSGYCFFHLREIYKYGNCLWALILSPAGIYLATCGQEDKMVFYLNTHLGICMRSLFGRLDLLLLLPFYYNKVVMFSRSLIIK